MSVIGFVITRNIALRDLELGDPKRERHRERARLRKLPRPEEYDIFGNPWDRFPDSVRAPEPVHVPVTGGVSRGLHVDDDDTFGCQRGPDLPHPDAFDLADEDSADPIQAPPPAQQGTVSMGALLALGPRVLRWKAKALDGKGKGKEKAPDIAALSAAAATAKAVFDEPLPDWLAEPKASAGPRDAHFTELDVDHPVVTPPDHDIMNKEHEFPIVGARPGVHRGCTWAGHCDRDCGEGPSRPTVARNLTSQV
ncbi:hypothetical protein J7T55_014744 [Diaporthe amygdali]|uniref:uncharacterized protein n=1 Tax=Phomopsis amygdali TaxID=1214568 RepID=UPI0022FE1D97|nr:uncharacterized protein J7T55_014744 [Diaporthe amygdali]KAJ0109942.1 hypothetical protein J7T55_014744 [Diaporthe amygdali]